MGRAYAVTAYVELDGSALEGGAVIAGPNGRWELRLGLVDGYWVDLRQLIRDSRRHAVGDAVHERGRPILERVRSQQNGHV